MDVLLNRNARSLGLWLNLFFVALVGLLPLSGVADECLTCSLQERWGVADVVPFPQCCGDYPPDSNNPYICGKAPDTLDTDGDGVPDKDESFIDDQDGDQIVDGLDEWDTIPNDLNVPLPLWALLTMGGLIGFIVLRYNQRLLHSSHTVKGLFVFTVFIFSGMFSPQGQSAYEAIVNWLSASAVRNAEDGFDIEAALKTEVNPQNYNVWLEVDDGDGFTVQQSSLNRRNFSFQSALQNPPVRLMRCAIQADSPIANELASTEPLPTDSTTEQGSFSPPTHDATVGAIGGQHQVGADGSANYSIPITVPAGVAGIQPDLAVNYNSNGGDGLLGRGWSLGGLSVIHRCARTMERDGRIDSVDFSGSDQFCLDGVRLVPVNGDFEHGQNQTEYHLEEEAYSQIIFHNPSSDHISNLQAGTWFEVKTRDGKVIQYGNSSDSAIEAGYPNADEIFVWGINRVEDRYGNAMTYSYEEETLNGDYRIKRIGYINDSMSINFEYSNRTSPLNKRFGGSYFVTLKKLDAISIQGSGGQEISRYTLGYDSSVALQRKPQLVSVQQCNGDHCLNPTIINWGFPYLEEFGAREQWLDDFDSDWNEAQYYATLRFVDLDADGKADICGRKADGVYCAFGNGTDAFTHLTKWTSEYSNAAGWSAAKYYSTLRYLDLDADGDTDICGRSAAGLYCMLNNGQAFVDAKIWVSSFTDADGWGSNGRYSTLQYGDLNGDGLVDVCGRNNLGIHCGTNLGNGQGFSPTWTWQHGFDFQSAQWNTESAYSTLRLVDINADGLDDICGRNSQGVYCALSDGEEFDPVKRWTLSFGAGWDNKEQYSTIQFVDINADGLPDICGRDVDGIRCGISNGLDNFSSVRWTSDFGSGWNAEENYSTIQFVDIDGDGLADVCGRSNLQGLECGINTRSGFAAKENWASQYGDGWDNPENYSTLQYADINGDGQPDFCGRIAGGVECSINKREPYTQVLEVTNGLNHKTRFSYSPLTDPAVYNKLNSASYPVQEQQDARYVVAQVKQGNGIGGYFTSSYSYDGLRAHLTGMGSLGFASITVLNEGTGIATKTTYSQDHAANTRGSPIRIETVALAEVVPEGGFTAEQLKVAHSDWSAWQANGKQTSYTSNNWQLLVELPGHNSADDWQLAGTDWPDTAYASCVANGYISYNCRARVYHRRLVSTSITKRDLNGVFLNKEVNDYTYDDYDNAKTITTSLQKESGAEIRHKTTTNNYYSGGANITDWLIGQVESTAVNVALIGVANSTVTRKSGWEYYPTTGRIKAEIIFDGNSGSSVQRTEYFDIDAFGNHKKTRVTGADFLPREASVVYDASGRFVIQATNALSHSVSSTYYPNSHVNAGKVDVSTDANGTQTKYNYDAFGRNVQTISAYGTANPVSSFTAFEWCRNTIGAMRCKNKTDPDNYAPVAKPVYRATQYTEGGAGAYADIDQLGREVKRASQAIDGRFVIVGNGYNALGHNTQVCEPYYHGETEHISKIEYDVLGRIIKSYNPFPDPSNPANTIQVIDTVNYNGLVRTSTNNVVGSGSTPSANQTKTQIRDEMGNLKSVLDNNGVEITYQYNVVGSMIKVTAPDVATANRDGNSLSENHNITTITYDGLGRKIAMNDPDKGPWTYHYNGLGELLTQTNAKGISSCTVYDLLGRKTHHYDNYAGNAADAVNQCASAGGNVEITQWNYDSAAGKGVGKLAAATSYNASNAITYESEVIYDATYGRPVSNIVTINESEVYKTDTGYDNYHRPSTITYPGNTAAERLTVNSSYNNLGFPVALKNAANDELYYELQATDVYGNVTAERYGNGVTTARSFDARTNRLNNIQSYALLDMSGPTVQNLNVSFDVIGNLTARSDNIQNIHETFGYDNLNRLTDMHLDMGNAQIQSTHVGYDALGNILNKSGVGTYTYGGNCNGVQAGPHAVTNVTSPKNASYCYDANGNMLSGDGRSINYTAFDKPALITKGSYTTAIQYSPNRSRYKRVDTNAQGQDTTYTYIGGYEKVNHPNGKVEERHYVGGFAIVTKETLNTTTTEKTRYLHKDHLGSITAITNELGMVVETFSFDPWGKRRAPNLPKLEELLAMSFDSMNSFEKSNLTLAALGLASPTTNKGFTGHEQMDGVGLIHMGGRVYDAELGRFLSADPHIQNRTNLQNLNRYSYVNNNPLSYTDPSGYFFKKLFKKLTKLVKKALHATVGKAWQAVWRTMWKPVLRSIAQVEGLSMVISIGLNFIPGCQAWCSMIFNAAMASANGGTIGDIATGAAIGFVTAGVPGGGGFWEAGLAGELGGMAVAAGAGAGTAAAVGGMLAGGIAAKAQGGKFIDGAKGAAAGMAVAYGMSRVAAIGEQKAAADGAQGSEPPNTDVSPEANPNLVGKNAVYDKNGQLNIDVTVRNGSPTVGSALSDNAFNRQLAAIRTDFNAVGVSVNFDVVGSGPADLVYFSGSGNGYSAGTISYRDTGAWRGTSSHEFAHFLTNGQGHAPNSSGSIISYANNRSVTRRDAQLIRDLYGQ